MNFDSDSEGYLWKLYLETVSSPLPGCWEKTRMEEKVRLKIFQFICFLPTFPPLWMHSLRAPRAHTSILNEFSIIGLSERLLPISSPNLI